MKKIIFTVGIALAICSFSSCSNEDNITNNPSASCSFETEADCEMLHSLNLQIDSINNVKFGLPSFYDNKLETGGNIKFKKGFLSKFWNGFKAVLRADAEGGKAGFEKDGIPGAVVGAVSSSVFKAIDLIVGKDEEVTRSMPQDCVLNDSLLGIYTQIHPMEYTNNSFQTDSIGIYHNRIVLKMFKEHNSVQYWKEAKDKDIVEITTKIAEQEMGVPTGRYSKNNMLVKNVIQHLEIIRAQTPKDEELYYKELKEKNPRQAKLIEIISNYINGLSETNNNNELIEYHDQIMNIIEESDVDENSKNDLRLSINIAFSSASLWNKEYFSKR